MANKRWIGGAPGVADVWTVTFANVWAAADTVSVTINNKTLTMITGSGVLNDIATEFAAMINAASATSPAPALGFSRNFGGQQFAEFAEVTAVANGAAVTITGNTAGLPITLSTAETTAGTGTASPAVHTMPATGPEHFDNADNWDTGTLPADLDTLFFDTGAVSCKYGLTFLRDGAGGPYNCNIIVSNDWTGQLGLPNLNPAGYKEYRQRYLQFHGAAVAGLIFHVLEGSNANQAGGNLYVDFQDTFRPDIMIRARRGNTGAAPSIFLAGSPAAAADSPTVEIFRGAVSLEPDDAPSASSKYMTARAVLRVGVVGGSATDAYVYFGRNFRLSEVPSMTINSGTVYSEAPTEGGGGADLCPITMWGGVLETRSAAEHDDVTVNAGAIFYPVGNSIFGDLVIRGTIDTRRAVGGITPASIRVHAGASIYDPANNLGGQLDLVGCTPAQLTAFQIPADRLIDYTAAATP